MSPRFKPNVTVACVIHCQGQFLLVEEKINNKIQYNQPAGHLEAHESLLDACKREVLEETGLKVNPEKLISIYQFTAENKTEFLRFTYAVELDECLQPNPQDPQIIAAHWMTQAQINQKQSQLRSLLVQKSIDDYLADKGTTTQLVNATFL